MNEMEKYFGYTEAEIEENFENAADQIDTNTRLNPTVSTLEQLAEASEKLIKENKEFLRVIYNELDMSAVGGKK